MTDEQSAILSLAQSRLTLCLKRAIIAGRFEAPRFFHHWFRVRGSCHQFIFRKNLRVTNIQFGELLALLRVNTSYVQQHSDRPHLQFVTSGDFRDFSSALVDEFPALLAKATKAEAIELLARRYGATYADLVAVEPLFGSCVVFLPATLQLDLAAVCAQSGYIHSCGQNLFVRKAYKAEAGVFIRALRRHVGRPKAPDKRLFFTVYSHQDFSGFDSQEGDIKNGLDDLKVSVDKAFMAGRSLIGVLREIREKFSATLTIPEPGDYREQHRKARVDPTIDRDRTLWLVNDRGISSVPRQKSDTSYFVCYEQLFHNGNPFHVFDEDKPAWFDHTTLPHTLAGAMLNLSRPYWPREGATIVADPFVGTGTTMFEALKFPNVHLIASDLNPVWPIVVSDNLAFFEQSLEQLQGLKQNLFDDLSRSLAESYAPGNQSKTFRALEWATRFFDSLTVGQQRGDDELTQAQAVEMRRDGSFDSRLMLYLLFRTARRHIGDFERGTQWSQALKPELTRLVQELRILIELRSQQISPDVSRPDLVFSKGTYSISCVVAMTDNHRLGHACSADIGQTMIRDARKLPPASCHVILTDPPYGFNRSAGSDGLADLFVEVIDVMIKALLPGGQLLFAVPEWSHTGHLVPFYIRKEFIILQVIMAARRNFRRVIDYGFSAPSPGPMFRAPFYWESERALRRAILHFQVQEE